MNDWLLALLMLVSGVITDITWAFYIQELSAHERTKEKRHLRNAAWWSVGTGMCTLVFIEGVVQNIWISLLWLVGLWFGTYYSAFLKQLFGIHYGKKDNTHR
jgi:hypothetical protein